MKTKLITILKSRVLLVDSLPENETIDFYENGVLVASDFEFDGVDGKWQLLSTIKDLKDSDCDGLVNGYCGMYENYAGGNKGEYRSSFFNAKKSFLSALEAENIYISGSYNGELPEFGDLHFLDKIANSNILKYKEAEQNVFSPETLVFIEQ